MSDSTGSDPRYQDPIVNHVGQCVADLGVAQAFYCDLLGFEVERELPLPDDIVSDFLAVDRPVGMLAVYLRRGDFVLELLHFDRPGNPAAADRPFNQPGLTHLSISINDFERVIDRVTEYGGAIVNRSPMASIVRDPDGQLLELLPMSYRRRLDGAT